MMARGVNICFSNANKREMYHEIYRRYLQMKEETGIAGFCILEQILEQPAPSYYINVATMKGIIYKSINKR